MTSYDLARRGLDESLEAYARRIRRTPDEARVLWRIESLRLLHVSAMIHGDTPAEQCADVFALVTRGLCRIAPGVSVPTAHVTWTEEGP